MLILSKTKFPKQITNIGFQLYIVILIFLILTVCICVVSRVFCLIKIIPSGFLRFLGHCLPFPSENKQNCKSRSVLATKSN